MLAHVYDSTGRAIVLSSGRDTGVCVSKMFKFTLKFSSYLHVVVRRAVPNVFVKLLTDWLRTQLDIYI